MEEDLHSTQRLSTTGVSGAGMALSRFLCCLWRHLSMFGGSTWLFPACSPVRQPEGTCSTRHHLACGKPQGTACKRADLLAPRAALSFKQPFAPHADGQKQLTRPFATDTIMDCDRLLVLSAGRLVEHGPPGGVRAMPCMRRHMSCSCPALGHPLL